MIRIGVCLDNVDQPEEDSFARLAALRPHLIGTLWTRRDQNGEGGTQHRRPVYDHLEELLSFPTYHVRVGPSRIVTPDEWAAMAFDALAELPPRALTERRVRLRCLNEINLPAEGGWAPEQYAEFSIAATAPVRQAAPLIPILCAPVSVGDPKVSDWLAALVAAYATPERFPFDGITANAYAHLVELADRLVPAAAQHLGVPVHLTEINTLAVAPGPARAAWLQDRITVLESRGWESVEIFIAGGQSYGSWDERYILRDDEAQQLGRWIASRPKPEPAVTVGGVGTPSNPTPTTTREEMPQPKMELTGAGGWVWYVESCGGAEGIIAKCRAADLRWVLIKAHDGGDVWPQFTPDLVAALTDAGLIVGAWGYCYGGGSGWGVDEEVNAADAVIAKGARIYVADVEAEYEGKPDQAERFASSIKSSCDENGVLFGYSPLPVIDYHTQLPYAQFNRACDLVMPQFYSRALGPAWPPDTLFRIWQRWLAQWQAWGIPIPPVAPVGESFGDAHADAIRAFEEECSRQGARTYSFWSLDETDAAEAAAMAEARKEALDLTAQFDGAWESTERIAAMADQLRAQATAIQEKLNEIKEKVRA